MHNYETVSTFCHTLYYKDYIILVYTGVSKTSKMKSELQKLTAGWMSTAVAVTSRMFPDTAALQINWDN
jgi:hypothetical protein